MMTFYNVGPNDTGITKKSASFPEVVKDLDH